MAEEVSAPLLRCYFGRHFRRILGALLASRPSHSHHPAGFHVLHRRVSAFPIVTPEFTMSLEFALPTPVPLHQFVQSPIVVEVVCRNPEFAHDH